MNFNLFELNPTNGLYSGLWPVYLLVIGLLIASIATIFSKKIEFSVFSMITTFALSGLIFIFIGIPFFGFIYLLVYTAAISILFLFVIMMLRIQHSGSGIGYSILGSTLPILLGILFAILLYSEVATFNSPIQLSEGGKVDQGLASIAISSSEWSLCTFDTMQGLAYVLYTEQVSLLILLSLVLLIVMVGIIGHLNNFAKDHKDE